jgi:high-affinity nickel-transport protein
MNLLTVLALGFFLGMRHATDADHVVAISTIVSRERSIRLASVMGALWGLGHTLTIVLVGGAILLLGVVIPTRVGLGMELSVAIMLVVLGGANLTGFLGAARRIGAARGGAHEHDYGHDHDHGHEGGHGHAHDHEHGPLSLALLRRLGPYQVARPLVVGVVHGLAGSAAVALLVLTTIREPAFAMAYLAVFGAGTIAGMMVITSALAMPLAYSARRFDALNRHMAWISGALSVAFGLFLIYQIGFVDGLFTASPRWTPR